MRFHCGRFTFEGRFPLVMGIVNLTTDSFSGDGLACSVDGAIERAMTQIREGVDLLDLGAESSRPGAVEISAREEIARLLPVIRSLRSEQVALSVDTCKPEVMAAVLAEGADMINDIRGFVSASARSVVAGSDCGICTMHMQGSPATMQSNPQYQDVVGDVEAYLQSSVARLVEVGVDAERITIDPGFGFGKSFEHNVALFKALPRLCSNGEKVLVGVSRKSMLGEITGRPVDERVAASSAAALMAASYGAAILRVHDVAETRDGLAVLDALGELN